MRSFYAAARTSSGIPINGGTQTGVGLQHHSFSEQHTALTPAAHTVGSRHTRRHTTSTRGEGEDTSTQHGHVGSSGRYQTFVRRPDEEAAALPLTRHRTTPRMVAGGPM